MAKDIKKRIETFRKVFDILDFSSDKKDDLFKELMSSILALASARVIERNNTIKEKLKGINEKDLAPENVNRLVNSCGPSIKDEFITELDLIFSKYVNEIVVVVSNDKKNQILQLWNSN